MLEFNVGELASRLRRALGVRGRMPLGLDEHGQRAVLGRCDPGARRRP